MSSVSILLQSPSTQRSSLNLFVILLFGIVQYYWINFFYASISSDIARDMQSYQGSIDGLAGESFEWHLFSPEIILHRTFVYGEYLASIIFQITGALGGTAIELHAATITTLTLTCICLQLNCRPNVSFVILLTFACPFIFANLLLGNTRQLWGCILILLFYGHTPLFEYFRKTSLSRFSLTLRIASFSLLILGTHIGSIFIFATVLLIDYLCTFYIQHGVPQLGKLMKYIGKIFLLGTVIFIGYGILGQADELWRIQSKLDFYSSEKDLHSYPYLTGGFFYLVILPLSVDVFYYLKRKPTIKPLRFPIMCIWFLIFMSVLLPFSHALDRILTSLVLFGYVKRLTVAGLKNENIFVFIRLSAAAYYIITR